MRILVTDRAGIEAGVRVRTPYIVISIRDPRRRKPKVRGTGLLRDVLYLTFHDAEPSEQYPVPPHVKLMTPKDASAIWQFVQKHRPNIQTIVVHCEQGMSRSPGVAAALAQSIGGDSSYFFDNYQPNLHVFSLVASAAGGRVG